MESSITFKFVNNPLHLLVASASIFDAITKAMWVPPACAVLASFFQAVISCFMASAWSWSLALKPLYDEALCSSCSTISSLAFSFQAALPFPLCCNKSIVGRLSNLCDVLTLLHTGVFQFNARNASQGLPRVQCS